MRSSAFVAAALAGTPALSWAQQRAPSTTAAVAVEATSSCANSTSTTISTVLEPPAPSWSGLSTTSTVNWTLTDAVTVIGSGSETAGPANATATATASTTAVVGTNAASPGEGIAGDSSVLGLVIFFALSLCIL